MGIFLLILLSVIEIGLVVWTVKKQKEKKQWLKNRTLVRIAEVLLAGIALLLPIGQKWRLAIVFLLLILRLIVACVVWLIRRNKANGVKKISGAVVSCVGSILLILITLIPAFLFTGYKGLPTSGEYGVKYTKVILIDETRTDPFETDGSYREVPAHFYYPDTQEDSGFPLIVFSHGAFGYYQSNTSTYMELASNGYVVVALDHPHHAFFTQDTDGNMIIVDSNFIQTAIEVGSEDEDYDKAMEKALQVYKEWMGLRVPDMNFVLDELKAAKEKALLDESWYLGDSEEQEIQRILAMTDMEHIGVMGHSMGGAASVEIGRERNDVSAVVDIDGTMLAEYLGADDEGYIINEEPYPLPLLEFMNWEQYNWCKTLSETGTRYANDVVMKNALKGYTTTVQNTEHMDFTDLPLLSPYFASMFGSGTCDKAETMNTVNSVILQFFDNYLKGKGELAIQEVY